MDLGGSLVVNSLAALAPLYSCSSSRNIREGDTEENGQLFVGKLSVDLISSSIPTSG